MQACGPSGCGWPSCPSWTASSRTGASSFGTELRLGVCCALARRGGEALARGGMRTRVASSSDPQVRGVGLRNLLGGKVGTVQFTRTVVVEVPFLYSCNYWCDFIGASARPRKSSVGARGGLRPFSSSSARSGRARPWLSAPGRDRREPGVPTLGSADLHALRPHRWPLRGLEANHLARVSRQIPHGSGLWVRAKWSRSVSAREL